MVTACQPGKTTLAIRWTQRTKMSCTASAMIGMVVILPKNSPPNSPSSRCCLHFSRIHSSSSCDQSICMWSGCLYLYMYNHTIMYRKEMKIQKMYAKIPGKMCHLHLFHECDLFKEIDITTCIPTTLSICIYQFSLNMNVFIC